MNQEIKKQWIAALRSGNYLQTKEFLKTAPVRGGQPRYCCLGVLCEIQGAKSSRAAKGLTYFNFFGKQNQGREDWPPYGLSAELTMRQKRKLANMNDEGRTFTEIADYIEEHY